MMMIVSTEKNQIEIEVEGLPFTIHPELFNPNAYIHFHTDEDTPKVNFFVIGENGEGYTEMVASNIDLGELVIPLEVLGKDTVIEIEENIKPRYD